MAGRSESSVHAMPIHVISNRDLRLSHGWLV